ncbi:MAG: hypothetical protein DMF59_03155 [Acidobacteria bacterium]|nr:MAG: hypothetical protein DMF59_03155 [Acidobacteriota bacterium]
MPHIQILRMLDVVIEDLRHDVERLVRRDRESESFRQARRKSATRHAHALRDRHEPRGRQALEVEERLVLHRVDVDVHVAHQLRRHQRLAIFADHFGLDRRQPHELGLRLVFEIDRLRAGGPFHRFVLLDDLVDVGKDLPLDSEQRRSDHDRKKKDDFLHDVKNNISVPTDRVTFRATIRTQ